MKSEKYKDMASISKDISIFIKHNNNIMYLKYVDMLVDELINVKPNMFLTDKNIQYILEVVKEKDIIDIKDSFIYIGSLLSSYDITLNDIISYIESLLEFSPKKFGDYEMVNGCPNREIFIRKYNWVVTLMFLVIGRVLNLENPKRGPIVT